MHTRRRRVGRVLILSALLLAAPACGGTSTPSNEKTGAAGGATAPTAKETTAPSKPAKVDLKTVVMQQDEVAKYGLALKTDEDAPTPADFYKPTDLDGGPFNAALKDVGYAQGRFRSFGSSRATPGKISLVSCTVFEVADGRAADGVKAQADHLRIQLSKGAKVEVGPSTPQPDLGENGTTLTSTYSDGAIYTYIWSSGNYVLQLRTLSGVGTAAAQQETLDLAKVMQSHMK